jgi:fructoselysine 6-kinase
MDRSELRIISVGETTIDDYVHLQKEYIGGISLNFAVQSKRAGADLVSLISCVGNNDHSRVLQKLAMENVDSSRVCVRSGRTARQKIIVNSTGERIFPEGGYDSGVLRGWQLQDSDVDFVSEHDVLASTCFQQTERLFQQVMALPFVGWRVADFLDLSDYDHDPYMMKQYLNRLKIAFISGDDQMVERVRDLSNSEALIVVTLGSKGSAVICGERVLYQPAEKVDRIIDSTGCGDAFQAAFTVSYWHEQNIQRALAAGAEQAAIAIQHYGAT